MSDNSPAQPVAANQVMRVPRACWIAVVALVLLKLVLVSHDEILAYTDDDYGYAYGASVLHWGVPYGVFSYARQPVYHLYLAAADVFGLPVRLWIEFTWAAAAAIMLVALRRLGLHAMVCLLTFALVLFHPWTLSLFNRFLCDSVYGLLLLVFLCSLAVGITRVSRASMFRWGLLAAVAGAIAANTRVEAILILGSIATAGVCAWWLSYRTTVQPRTTRNRLGYVVLLPLVAVFGLTHAIKAINQRHIGSYVTTDLEMPGFKKLYRALISIRPSKPDLRLSAPRDAREWAYANSPTFAQLRPLLESDPAVLLYAENTAQITGVRGEYGAWTVWALRIAAWRLHPWNSAGELDAFYAKAAEEISAALKAHPEASRWAPVDFIPPEWNQLGQNLPGSLASCWRALYTSNYARGDDMKLDAEGLARFNAIGNRRIALVKLHRNQKITGSAWDSPRNVVRLDRIKRGMDEALRPVVLTSVVITGIGTLVGLVGIRRRLFPDRWYILSVLLISAIAGRVLIVALLDVTGIGVQMRYLFPCAAPLLILGTLNAGALLNLFTGRGKRRAEASAVPTSSPS